MGAKTRRFADYLNDEVFSDPDDDLLKEIKHQVIQKRTTQIGLAHNFHSNGGLEKIAALK